MTLEEIILGGGAMVLLLSAVQISPLKINPWSWLGKGLKWCVGAFGRALEHGAVRRRVEACHIRKEINMKNTICAMFGMIGGWIASALGGWDMAMKTLVFLMVVDYISGVIVAGVFHKSKKTNSGSLKSIVGFKGLCRKLVQAALVGVGHRLDLMMGQNYIREAIALAFIANECLSILENAGLMGIPLPKMLVKAIDVLSEKNEVVTVEEEKEVEEEAV